MKKLLKKNRDMTIKKILCISFLLFIRCGAVSVSDTLEDWQENQKDNDFWYGTAIIQKANQENIQEVARNAAINEIASQIKIKIKQDIMAIDKLFSKPTYLEMVGTRPKIMAEYLDSLYKTAIKIVKIYPQTKCTWKIYYKDSK